MSILLERKNSVNAKTQSFSHHKTCLRETIGICEACIVHSSLSSFGYSNAIGAPEACAQPMPSKEELEELPLDVLAVWCKRVADRPDQCTEAVAANAEKLRRQWFHLQGPPRSSVVEQEELERQRAELKKRMAEFLADVLLS